MDDFLDLFSYEIVSCHQRLWDFDTTILGLGDPKLLASVHMPFMDSAWKVWKAFVRGSWPVLTPFQAEHSDIVWSAFFIWN